MSDAVSLFKDEVLAAGLEPPDIIVPGRFHRFPGAGKPKGNTAGWCILFEDGQGGCFGDWSTGLTKNWQAKLDEPLSQSERAVLQLKIKEAQKRAAEEKKRQQTNTAKKAAFIWENAPQANDDHPYLLRKKIPACVARLYKGSLIVPVESNGQIHSLQFIDPNGSKRFLRGSLVKGGYCCIGKTMDTNPLCIAEGFATAVTIHLATGYRVVAAFNTGNLEAVAKVVRQMKSESRIIICADDDVNTKGNPGVTHANKAARSIGAKVAIPVFKEPRAEGATDFNDMAAQVGMEEVERAIRTARPPDRESDSKNWDWPDPQPLLAAIEPESYPLDALPETIRVAVEEVQAFTKAPVPLVASSALAAVSLAVQAQVDVKRDERLIGPVSLNLLTIADSGERKSTCDEYFMQAIHEYEAEHEEAAKPLKRDFSAKIEAWEAKRNGIAAKIRELSRQEKPAEEQEIALCELEQEKPEPPRVPQLIIVDATPEALKWGLVKVWSSRGVISGEGGLVFGSHGMGKDSILRNLTTLNILWDGGEVSTERRTSESFTVRGARLTVALQVQKATLCSFLEQTCGLARGTGFLARFLISWPESTQGSRFYTEAPVNWQALDNFNQRVKEILNQDVPMTEEGRLTPSVLPLGTDAKAAWVTFHDAIESKLSSSGELYEVRDVASKIADNAARIAALFQYFKHGSSTEISQEVFEGASRIAAWHLYEAKRLYVGLPLSEEQANAARLDEWSLDRCLKKNSNIISRRDVQQNVTPLNLRQKAVLNATLKELTERNRIREVLNGKRKEIHINPALLKRKAQ